MKLNQEILKGLSEAVGDKLPTVFEFNKKWDKILSSWLSASIL